jgi:hypothetical protein
MQFRSSLVLFTRNLSHSKNWTLSLSSVYFRGDGFAVCSQREDNDNNRASTWDLKMFWANLKFWHEVVEHETPPAIWTKTKEHGTKHSGGSATLQSILVTYRDCSKQTGTSLQKWGKSHDSETIQTRVPMTLLLTVGMLNVYTALQYQHEEKRVRCSKCYPWVREYSGFKIHSLCAQPVQNPMYKWVSYLVLSS